MTSNRRHVKTLMKRARYRAERGREWREEFIAWREDYQFERIVRWLYNP